MANIDVAKYVRQASEEDLASLLEIEAASFEQRWDVEQFRAALKEISLVCEDKGVTGFITACYCPLAQKGIILRIAVMPPYRGQGIAKLLIAAALARLKDLGAKDVELSVDIVRTGAIKLYEKFGFKVMQVVSPNHDDDEESFYIMTLHLD